MSVHDEIDRLLNSGISIMDREITLLQSYEQLDNKSLERLMEIMKVLVVVRRDWRITEEKEEINVKKLSNEEIEAAILAEAEKIRKK